MSDKSDLSEIEYQSYLSELFDRFGYDILISRIKKTIFRRAKEIEEIRERKTACIKEYQALLEAADPDEKGYEAIREEAIATALRSYTEESFYSSELDVIHDFLLFLKAAEEKPAETLYRFMEFIRLIKTKTDPTQTVYSRHRMLVRRINNHWLQIYSLVKPGPHTVDDIMTLTDFTDSDSSAKQEILSELKQLRTKIGIAGYIEPEDTEEDIEGLTETLTSLDGQLMSLMDKALALTKDKRAEDEDELIPDIIDPFDTEEASPASEETGDAG